MFLSPNKLEISFEALGEDERPKMAKFSSLEGMNLYTNGLEAKMTILPSSLQGNHHNAITQIKGQECPSTFKKKQCIKNWHENEWRTKYHNQSVDVTN